MIFGNMGEIMKMAGQLKKIKDELERALYEASVEGVSVKVSGDMVIKEIKGIKDIKDIDRIVKDAVNKALKTAKDEAAKKMKGVAGGLGLPGLF